MESPGLPKFDYYVDLSDPDILVLRRQDGTSVAAFSALGANDEGIMEAAKEDYHCLVRENAHLFEGVVPKGMPTGKQRSA